jgi:hypothetical protein
MGPVWAVINSTGGGHERAVLQWWSGVREAGCGCSGQGWVICWVRQHACDKQSVRYVGNEDAKFFLLVSHSIQVLT